METNQFKGYLAVPESGKGRGVLVLHPWWGLNDTIKSFCTRLSQEGFIAYAPDLYHGKLATTIPQAEELSSTLDESQAKMDVAQAVDFLCQQLTPEEQGIAVIGFSLGAYFALDASAADPERVRAVVLYYGSGPGDFTKAKASYLGHFAGNDDYEPAEFVDGLEAGLQKAGRPVTFYRYDGVGHWFCEPDRVGAYNPHAAELAWQRTLEFLREN